MDSLNLEEPSLASSSSMTSLGEASNMSEMSRDLASGNVAPIAARESVFKYQMALKEDQVILHQFVLTDLLGLSQVNYDFFKSSSILRKFLVFNFVVFLILGVFTFLYLNAIKPNLVKESFSLGERNNKVNFQTFY